MKMTYLTFSSTEAHCLSFIISSLTMGVEFMPHSAVLFSRM